VRQTLNGYRQTAGKPRGHHAWGTTGLLALLTLALPVDLAVVRRASDCHRVQLFPGQVRRV
jgi:hypothetical protein